MANSPNTGIRGNESRTGNTQNPTGNMQNQAGNAADRARDAARGAVESARDTATGVMDRARDMAGNVADKAARHGRQRRRHRPRLGERRVSAVKDSNVVNKAEEYVSEAWDTGSRYFQEHSFKDMAEDVAGVIRRNPIPALLVGVGLGFILARSLRS